MASSGDRVDVERELVFASCMRSTPTADNIRAEAAQLAVELAISRVPTGEPATVKRIRAELGNGRGPRRAWSDREVLETLRQLEDKAHITSHKQRRFRHGRSFTLVPEIRERIRREEEAAADRWDRTVNKLFPVGDGNQAAYAAEFERLICRIFSRLAEQYVACLGPQASRSFGAMPDVQAETREAAKRATGLDQRRLERAVTRFVAESDYDFDAIKWQLVQARYVSLAIGAASDSGLLGAELLRDTTLVLDTNVIIHALEPDAELHESFRFLLETCKKLGATPTVAPVSLEELGRVLDHNAKELPRTAPIIPDELVPEVNNVFLARYLQARAKDPNVQVEDVLAPFRQASTTLADEYGITILGHAWFAEHEDECREAAKLLRAFTMQRRKKKKEASALHDSQLMGFAAEEIASGRKAAILTLDGALTGYARTKDAPVDRRAVLWFPGIVHWLSAALSDGDEELVPAFAAALRGQLLPETARLSLDDFQVFAEYAIDCRQMPPEDVRDCIEKIQRLVPDADLSDVHDRNEVYTAIRKYYVDPATKQNQTIADLKAKLELQEEEHQKAIKGKDEEITKKDTTGSEWRKKALQAEAWPRLGLVFLLWIATSAGLWYLLRGLLSSTDDSAKVAAIGLLVFLICGSGILYIFVAVWLLGEERLAELPSPLQGWLRKKAGGE